MDQRYNELKKNTLIIAISNIGSKSIAFLLAPIYSHYLDTSQYGVMDLVTTTVSLVTPIICLDIYEATFRYSNDDTKESKILSSSLVLAIPSVIALLGVLIFFIFNQDHEVILYTSIYLVLNVFCNILEQENRGYRRMRIFAYAGIVNSVFLLLFNYVFMIVWKMQLTGWLISFVSAKACEVIYLLYATKVWKHVAVSSVDKELINGMLKYCIPLLPTTTMWWIMNASDRYMLTFFVGASANGIYAVSNKIPSILSAFERIFYQSWQTSAIRSKNNDDYEEFYSEIFNKYLTIISIGIMAVMLVSKLIISVLFDAKYITAWYCVMPLLLAVLVHSLSGNLGTIYVTFKKTKGALTTSFWGAVTNIVLNAIFIPIFGMIAAAYTTLIGYFVTLVVRWIDCQKFVKIKIDVKNAIFYVAILIVSSVLYYQDNLPSIILRCVILLAAVIKERETIVKVFFRFNK